VHSPASVSDVVNEGVLRVLKAERLPAFEDVRVFRAYLWRAAWRLLLDRLRARGQEIAYLDENATQVIEKALAVRGDQSVVEREDSAGQMAMAMALLDVDQRRVLDLRFYQQKSIDEVADQLGVSVEAARKRVVRAVKSLEQKLRGWRSLVGS
jgi:RNA polymerase sigma-70 factor (ECF subfamily)